MLDLFQSGGEVTQHGRLVNEVQPLHPVGVLLHLAEGLDDKVHVGLGIGGTRNGQAQQLRRAGVLLAGGGVAPQQQGTYLHRADAGDLVELAGQGVGRELIRRDVGQQLARIHEGRMAPACWHTTPMASSPSTRYCTWPMR